MRATFAARPIFLLSLAFVCWALPPGLTVAQAQQDRGLPAAEANDPQADARELEAELDEELERQRQIAERFLLVLERNPRRGTALDKVYGFHLEAGTLETFSQELRSAAEKQNDGTQWMILGLVESQRGRDAAAVEALKKATELRPDDALAPFYLGQAQALIGQPDEAAASFETSIARNPAPTDALEVFQALGRAHQRAHRTEEALAVWKRLEEQFPGDVRVQERIAVALAEEGQLEAALPRYEALIQATDDDYRRVVFQMEAAELKVRLDRASEGIADLERALATLNPESWLFREVRRKIEDVFLRTEDREGLATYYEGWLEGHPEDVDAMARLAKSLAAQARIPEARERLDQALKLAPTRADLRLTFIAQLVEGKNFAAALDQYEKLDELDPGNPDHLRAWGKLHLRDDSRSKEDREQAASAVWRRIVEARPGDPLLAAQTADLFRQAEMKDEALALYEKAVELAPAAPQYREYLGEYLHLLDRRDEALAVWRGIAEGEARTAENLARLAEVLARFGYFPEALPEIAAACELDPRNFALHLTAADLRSRAEAYEEALASLDAAEALAQNDEERESVLARRIRTLQSADRLEAVAEELAAAIDEAAPAERWFLLARYREALRRLPEATSAIEQALAKQPGHVRSLDAAARIAESSGELEKAADLNRRLVTVDRRGRTTYLERIASLESQLGRIDAALAAGRELIASAPGNVDAYQFFADLCARLDRPDEGIDALRRAARVNPHEPNLLLSLAAALADRFRTDEAIEIYWQAYEKSGSLDDRLLVINKQADLYLQTNRFDQLLERLERGRAEPETRREATICLAQAYHAAGDFGMARQELESLLGENSRDTQLLLQLSKLAESESDLAGAIAFQERLAELAPGSETEYRLATLLGQHGDDERSAEILVRLSLAEEDPAKLLRNVDRLLSTGKSETALRVVQAKLRETPQDWDLLTREGVALFRLDRGEEAAEAFRKILSLSLADDEKSAIAPSSPTVYYYAPSTTSIPFYHAFVQDDAELARLSRELGLDPRYGAGYTPMQQFPAPTRFGAARASALVWLYLLARKDGTDQEYLSSLRERAESEEASENDLVDWYRLRVCLPEQAGARDAARLLVRRGLSRGRVGYLQRLRSDPIRPAPTRPGQAESIPPLPDEDLDLAVACFQALDAADGDATPPAFVTQSLIVELDRSGRSDEADAMLERLFEASDSPSDAASVLQTAASRKRPEDVRKYFDRFARLDLESRRQKSSNRYYVAGIAETLAQEALDLEEAFDLFDAYLDWQSASTELERERSKSRTSSANSRTSFSYQYWSRGTPQVARNEATLVPMDRFDSQSIIALRNLHERCRNEDRLEEFESRLAGVADDPSAAARDVRLYAGAYVARWNGDEAETARIIRSCAELFPQDFALRMTAATYHAGVGELEEALAILDAVSPTDQRATQERELLALDLAVRLGDRERATAAARRLFGLRLPSETQVVLASQMRRLGMNEEADAALARAQRQAGGRIPALAALMAQYQAQGDDDVAKEVAYRILQRSRPPKNSAARYMASNSDEAHRQAALQCLSATGELDDAIAALEEQIARTPEASQLYERLAEYVRADGDADKELELLRKLCELNPKDAVAQTNFARRASERGKHAEACDAYVAALAIDPAAMEDDYYQLSQTFQAADRMPDLVKAFEQVDLAKIRQPYYVVNLVENFVRQEKTRPAGIALLKRAAKELPSFRSYLWRSLDTAEAWDDAELLELGAETILFGSESGVPQPWSPFESPRSYSGEGRVSLGFESLIEGFRKANRAQELERRLDEAIAKRPDWQGGKALKLWLDAPNLDAEAAIARAKELFGERQAPFDQGEYYARWAIGLALEKNPSTKAYAADLLVATGPHASFDEFSYSPSAAAYRIYKELGRTSEAVAILKSAIPQSLSPAGPDIYERGRVARQLVDLGRNLAQAGESLEAVRVYARLLSEPTLVDPEVSRNYTSQPDYFRQQATQGLESALAGAAAEGIDGEEFASILMSSFSGDDAGALAILERKGKASEAPQIYAPFLELLSKSPAEDSGAIEETLNRLAADRPDDFSVAVATTILALRDLDDPKAAEALDRLVETTKRNPLSPVEGERRPSAKQRREAAPQIALWLAARRAEEKPDFREAARTLADRSVEAAARQADAGFLHAILLERGALAHAAGDADQAQAIWAGLLDRLFPPPEARAGSGEPAFVPPATASQFETATSLSILAADRGLSAVSFDAMRRALAGGLPVPDMPAGAGANLPSGVVMSVPRTPGAVEADPTLTLVGEGLRNASTAWKRNKFSAEEASRALEAIVFPASRPKEILFLPSDGDPLTSPPESVAAELAYWAAEAGRDAEIEQAVAARSDLRENEAIGLTLLALAALECEDAKLAAQRLAALAGLWEGLPPHARQIVAHAPLAAVARPSFAEVARPFAETAALGLAESNADGRRPSTSWPTGGDLATTLVASRARGGDAQGAIALGEKFLELRRRELLRYGDYGYALVRAHQGSFADAVASAGDVEATLGALAKYLDAPQPQQNYRSGAMEASAAIERLHADLATLAPQRRYELLRDWTLPTADRKTLRAVTVPQPAQRTPEEFRSDDAPRPVPAKFGVLSTFAWLVDAAEEAGALQELRGKVRPLADEKLADADLLLLLIDVEADQVAAKAKLTALIDAAKKRPDERPQEEAPEQARSAETQRLEALAAAAALEKPALVEAATTLLEELMPEYDRRHNTELRLFGAKLLARRYAERARGDADALFRGPGLAYWHAESGSGVAGGPAAPIFVAHDGVVAHLGGDGIDRLFFRYPLGGEFRISFESTVGWAKQAELGFGGTVCESRPWEKCVYVYDAVHRDSLRRPEIPSRWENGWDRTEVHVSPESVRWYVHGQLAFEDRRASPASPWLYLSVAGERLTRLRDIRIEGDPQILREVPLIAGDSLDGWQSAEGIPATTRLSSAEAERLAAEGEVSDPTEPRAAPRTSEWSALDGTLTSLPSAQRAPYRTNLLTYFRPLQAGETLSYEFFYEPGVAAVHPALGMTAFVLDEEGTKLRLATLSMATTASVGYGRSTKEEASAEPYRLGPERPPLRAGEWNRAEIQMDQDRLTLVLNDEPILEKPVALSEDRRFGFFRLGENEEVRVRNVLLRGDWPEAFPKAALDDALALADDPGEDVRRARHAAIGETYYLEGAYDVYRRSLDLPADLRYDYLARWVLPGADHPTLRTVVTKTPLDPPSLEGLSSQKAPAEREVAVARRIHRGGEAASPALELVRAAKETGRLDELEDRIVPLAASSDPAIDGRAVEAMLVAIDLAAERIDSAIARMKKLRETAAGVPPERGIVERGPDLLALFAALERPETLEEARTTAARLVETARAPGTPSEWDQFVRREWGAARAKNDPASGREGESAPANLLHWQPVALPTARTRADGRPASKWRVADGEVEYLGGNADDALYFSTPLAGDFDVVCEVHNGEYREMRILYDAASLFLQRGGLNVRYAPHGRGFRDVPTPAKLRLSEWVELRLRVRGRELVAFANGQEAFRTTLSEKPDPWLAFMTKLAFTHGAIRNFRIEGTPTIPREMELFAGEDLVGGAAVYYEESVGGEATHWKRVDGEIRADRLENAPGRFAESVLRYHRPMLEDGEIEYRFFWSGGESEVHPALDRFVFVLRPEGVAAHAMTDGKWDPDHARPDEIVPLQDAVPVPLKENDWNAARLVVEGDVATLFVNDRQVARRTLPPTNQRTFGLFRWADRSGVRVRDVVHRGDWPTELPPAEERSFVLSPSP